MKKGNSEKTAPPLDSRLFTRISTCRPYMIGSNPVFQYSAPEIHWLDEYVLKVIK